MTGTVTEAFPLDPEVPGGVNEILVLDTGTPTGVVVFDGAVRVLVSSTPCPYRNVHRVVILPVSMPAEQEPARLIGYVVFGGVLYHVFDALRV